MPRLTLAVLLAVFATLMPAARAVAGIADSPLPVLVAGQTTLHLYSVPFVQNGGGLGVLFACTSTSSSAQTVGVELFGSSGGAPMNNAATTAVSVPAGGNVTFGTSNMSGFLVDQSLSAIIFKGSARILSTSKSLVCDVGLVDITSGPPISMKQLTIIAKTKQKAAN